MDDVTRGNDPIPELKQESPDWTIEKLREEIRGLSSQLEIAHKQEQATVEMLRDTRNALRHAMSLLAYFGSRA